MKKEKTKEQKIQLADIHSLIKKFLKENIEVNWPSNIKIAKELLTSRPDLEYWAFLELKFKLNHLAWFKTIEGIEFLLKQDKEFEESKKKVLDLPLSICYEVGDKKIGEDIKVSDRPKQVIMDFLR